MRRRALLLAPALLAGCSVFPDRPNVPVRRYILAPRRAETAAPRPAAPVLMVRRVRGIPGLQELGLRRARADGSYEVLPYEEWIAPPADLAEAALRGWLQGTGLFAAVVAPGSRLDAALVLELQLTALESAPFAGEARAALAGVLLREERLSARVLAPFEVVGIAPLARDAAAPAEALAMQAALGVAFSRLEQVLAPFAR
jgi:ABC-type uncharacterized transport system auxiliary subunit